jgi:hypothetical protein
VTYGLNFELGDDPLQSLNDDIRAEERRLARSERAEIEGRVVNRTLWLTKLAASRARISQLEARLAEMVALEEADA